MKYGKNLVDIVARLGPTYSIRVIDGENVGYRDTGNGYEVEISGLDNNKVCLKAAVFVWRISPREIVRRRFELSSIREVLHAVRVIEELVPYPQALEEE